MKLTFILAITLITVGAVTMSKRAYSDEPLTAYAAMHGALTKCDNETQEQHLYLLNSKELGLDDVQIKKLREIDSECGKECSLDKARLRVAKMEMNEILKSDNINMKEVLAKSTLISEIMNDLRVRFIRARVEAMMVLDEEQKEKMKVLR